MRKRLLRGLVVLIALLLTTALLVLLDVIPRGPAIAILARATLPHRVVAGWADLRTDTVLTATAAEQEKGRQLLEALALRHGRESWREHETIEVVARDLWAGESPWWPKQEQGLRLQQLLGTFTSRAELLDGPGAGEVWGLQSWAPYRGFAIGTPTFLAAPDAAITFYLPSLHYFNELPFRLPGAPVVVYAGETALGNRLYDRVFVSWGESQPSGEYDQYVLWIGRESKLLEKAHYTVREAAALAEPGQVELMRAAAAGTIHFSDYRSVDGVMFPFRQVVTLFGPEQAKEPLEQNYFHMLVVEQARFDTVPRQALLPSPLLPEPGDRKQEPAAMILAARATDPAPVVEE